MSEVGIPPPHNLDNPHVLVVIINNINNTENKKFILMIMEHVLNLDNNIQNNPEEK